jgi:selenocysteine-specific translation elongation factor
MRTLTLCTVLAIALAGCTQKQAIKADTTELIIDKTTGVLRYTNARDCDIVLEMADGAQLPEAATTTRDVLLAIKTLRTTCNQNRGVQELRSEVVKLQDARVRDLEARLAEALGVAFKAAPKPPGAGLLLGQ